MPEILYMQRHLHFYFSEHSCFILQPMTNFQKSRFTYEPKINSRFLGLILFYIHYTNQHFDIFKTEPENF